MPFTGSQSPSPERYGGGVNGSSINLVQHVYRAIAQARGSAFDQSWPPTSPVGIENLAFARAIAIDGYGQNDRLANNMFPSTMTAVGNLGRWEKILALSVLPSDTEVTRRARVAMTMARFGQPNANQQISDACAAVLGLAFIGMVFFNPSNDTYFVNGISNVTVSPLGGGHYTVIPTVTGTPIVSAVMAATITGNGGIGVGNFTWTINGSSPTSATIQATNPLGTTGVSLNFDAGNIEDIGDIISWRLEPTIPWLSTIAQVNVQASYQNALYLISDGTAQGSPNAAWWALIGQVKTLLDTLLSAWATFNIFVNDSAGAMGFKLDEPNFDLEAFGS